MKDFCVDLELAKELKENGFPQKSLFYWLNWDKKYLLVPEDELEPECYFYSAPISDEILKELLLHEIWIKWFPDIQVYQISGSQKISNLTYLEIYNKKLSNALAELWLDLKKEGYIQ